MLSFASHSDLKTDSTVQLHVDCRMQAPTLLAQVTLVAEENWKLPSIEFIVSWVVFLLVVESAFSSIRDHSQVCDILISDSPPRTRPSPIPYPSSSSHLSPCQSMSSWQVVFADVGFIWKHRKNCECCPGHYQIENQYSSMSWFKFRSVCQW